MGWGCSNTSCLMPSAAQVMGFMFATAFSQSGMSIVGKRAAEANMMGRFSRLITPIRVSWFSMESAMVTNMAANPVANRPSMTTISSISNTPNPKPSSRPVRPGM